MPVRAFDAYLSDRRLAQTHAISLLKDCRLGIEASHYLRRLLNGSGKEPLLAATGGRPLALRKIIETELDALVAAKITPVFIFHGTNISRKDRPFAVDDTRPQKRAVAWEMHDEDRTDQAIGLFSEIVTPPSELSRWLQDILLGKKIEFFVAPMSAWAQLSYLYNHANSYIDAVWGSTELFLFDIDRIITTINFTKGNFSWLNKRVILNDLGVNETQFVDMCILAGFELCRTFPPLESAGVPFSFRGPSDMMRSFRSGIQAVLSYGDNPQVKQTDYLDRFRRAKCTVLFHVIMTDEGKLAPFHAAEAPNDIHEFLGQRLPEELYFYLSRGLIGTQVLNTLISGSLIENAPLDNGEAIEYHRFLDKLMDIRAQSVGLLAQPLNRYYQAKRVSAYHWYDPTGERVIAHRVDPSPYEQVNSWNVKDEFLSPHLSQYRSSKPSIRFAILSLVDSAAPELTISKPDHSNPLSSNQEIIANTIWRTMQLRKFVSPDHTLSQWGISLATSLAATRAEDELDDALVWVFELVRYGGVLSTVYSPSYSGRPLKGSETERRYILLIARVAGLLQLAHDEVSYQGPLSRNLLSFNSFVVTINRSLRNLMEMVLLSMFLNVDAQRLERQDWAEISFALPFQRPINTALSIAMKLYLEQMVTIDQEKIEDAVKMDHVSHASSHFPHAVDVGKDLKRAFRLWSALVEGLRIAEDQGVLPSDARLFFEADEWLKGRSL